MAFGISHLAAPCGDRSVGPFSDPDGRVKHFNAGVVSARSWIGGRTVSARVPNKNNELPDHRYAHRARTAGAGILRGRNRDQLPGIGPAVVHLDSPPRYPGQVSGVR